MLATSDVLVDNLRDGALERLGLDDHMIDGVNPVLVQASITAFGTGNRWSSMPGFDPDPAVNHRLGSRSGRIRRPSPSTAPIIDAATGALGALGILAGSTPEDRTEEGSHTDVARCGCGFRPVG